MSPIPNKDHCCRVPRCGELVELEAKLIETQKREAGVVEQWRRMRDQLDRERERNR